MSEEKEFNDEHYVNVSSSVSARVYPRREPFGRGQYKNVASAKVRILDWVIGGFSVMDGPKGLFVSFPNQKDNYGDYKALMYSITKEARKLISDIVLKGYEEKKFNVKPVENTELDDVPY